MERPKPSPHPNLARSWDPLPLLIGATRQWGRSARASAAPAPLSEAPRTCASSFLAFWDPPLSKVLNTPFFWPLFRGQLATVMISATSSLSNFVI